MEKLFGVPIGPLTLVLSVVFVVILALMGFLALRNRVLWRIAVRNIPRRPLQTALILMGLMLASLLFSASFSTGDTLTHSIRTSAVENLGLVDVVVRDETREATGRRRYFDDGHFHRIKEELMASEVVDGVAPYIVEQMPVVAPSSGQSEPQVRVVGMDGQWMAGFGVLRAKDGTELPVEDLGPGDVYISTGASDKLDIGQGEQLALFFGTKPVSVSVGGIFSSGAPLSRDVLIVAHLPWMQEVLGVSGQINTVLVSNQGGVLDGADRTTEVMNAVESLVAGTGLEATPIKRDALNEADEAGSIFSTIFLLFGQFSIAAGILLIFLIFVMLAAERRRELGIARAVGTQRGHIILLFAFEGGIYALIAGVVGALMGILVGWAMVGIMTAAFGSEGGFRLAHMFNLYSVVLAYVLGVVLTFIVVVFSAWRVSRSNVVRAIRDIPDPRLERRTLRGLLLALGLPLLGLVIVLGGVQAKQWGTYLLGSSLIIIGLPLLARRLGWLKDRAAFTTAAVLLLVWWFLPGSTHEAVFPSFSEFQEGIELFFLSGIMVVTAGVWLVVYNADLLLKAIVFVFGRIRGLPPILKTAISYPMEYRFRTGMTLAMFSLVVFTLIVMAFILTASSGVFSDPEKLGGGFHIRGSVSYANPIWDMDDALNNAQGVNKSDFEAVGSFTGMPVKVKQAGTTQDWTDFFVQGVDQGYTDHITYGMATMVEAYQTPKEVWRVLQDEPGVAVVSPAMVSARANYSFGPQPGVTLEGFYVEDSPLPDVYIDVEEPVSGSKTSLRVIGVMELGAFYGQGIVTSQETLSSIVGQPLPPQAFMFDVRPGVDAKEVAKALEAEFLENGFQAEVLAEEIEAGARTQLMVNNLLQGFMGLGLVVGIAALGVIAARSVVERRQEIGMVRALGFQRGMVQASFLIESSFVALLGIGIGVALGIGLSAQIIDSMKEFFPSIQYRIPVVNVVAIILIAYVASILTTFLPSLQASRIYPAEALRYE